MATRATLAEELQQFEVELIEAEQRHNLLALDQLLAEDFVLITTRGRRLVKREFLEFLEDARMTHYELLNIEIREIVPGVALVVADLYIDMTVHSEPIPRHLSLSTVWRKSAEGTWACAFRQNSAIPAQ